MPHKRFALIFLIGLISTPAFAADWVAMDYDDEIDVFYDRNSISNNGHLRTVWMKFTLKPKPSEGIYQSIDRVEFLCSTKQMRTISAIYYIANGSTERSKETPDAAFTDIVAGSTADTLRTILCSPPAPN